MLRSLKSTLRSGACDSHTHVYGDRRYFAWKHVNGREMENCDFDGHIVVRHTLGLSRKIIIQTPHSGTDNRSRAATLATLAQERSRGIAMTESDVSELEVNALRTEGVGGLRFSTELIRGMCPEYPEHVATRIAALGWHMQYRSTEKDLPYRADRLGRLPVDIVLDHIASLPAEHGMDLPAFTAMTRLIDGERHWVKLLAVYQLSKFGAPNYAEYWPFAPALASGAPGAHALGHQLASPEVAFLPDDTDLLETMLDWVDNDVTQRQILTDNPARLYGFEPIA